MKIYDVRGGINLRLPAWSPELIAKEQCVYLRNLTHRREFVEPIEGTKKHHGTSLGGNPITAIMPYYNDQTDAFKLLVASGSGIYVRDEQANEFSVLKSGLTVNSIFSSVIRHGVQYIASVADGLKKYLGGNQIESVGGGLTAPGSFRQVLYAKEVDRLFGISDDAIYGQISWCDLSDPETWQGDSIERFKLKDGERVEGGELLYGKLIVFCTYTIWIYYIAGNEENWKLEEAPTTVGCVAPNTIKKVGNEIWFLGESPRNDLGVYAFNGSTSRLLTDDVTPLFLNANTDYLRDACAELHEDVYTISWAGGASVKNNISIDLDVSNLKEDGAPAIYGPHDIAFYSSAVLNNRQNGKEWLLGDQTDGFVYKSGGETLKSINGQDGQLLQSQFISAVHNDDDWDTMKSYEELNVFFRPRAYFQPRLKVYFSYSAYSQNYPFNTAVLEQGFAGEFNVFEKRVMGTPEIYQHQEFGGVDWRGTSIQIEIINDVKGQRIAFDGYNYKKRNLYATKKVQSYAI